MKKVVTAILGILLVWNMVLTFQLSSLKSNEPNTNLGQNTTTNVVANITSDLTALVEDTEEKVVGVTSISGGAAIGTGSGVIYSVDDNKVYVVTNHHVIDGATEIVVRFANTSEVKATLVGSDQLTDLALLEMEVDFEAKAFKLGDSSLTKKGEYVIAMGSPLGLEFQGSVTGGLISGVNRSVGVDLDNNGTDDWDSVVLQTDAAINPGNSGGALINMAGELIGINSMKIADTSVEGIGFAIPINEVIPVIEQLAQNGKVERPILGISARSIDEFTAYERAYFKIDDAIKSGLIIADVSTDSPAALAGVEVGDILTAFDGVEITSFKQFRQELYQKKVGERVTITVYRDGSLLELNVTLK
ncbi:MAG: S1C family serine protease [Erysipelotrichaceae bacterium]